MTNIGLTENACVDSVRQKKKPPAHFMSMRATSQTKAEMYQQTVSRHG